MDSVSDLSNDLRGMDDTTTGMLIQDALDSLLKREAVYDHTELGDNVLDLIAGELQNALGEGGAAATFAVANMFAAPGARIGALNPVQAGRDYLSRRKTGKNAEIKAKEPAQISEPTGTLFELDFAVVTISYATSEFTLCGGIPGIFDVKQSFMAGILVIADAPDGLNFQCVGPNTLADWRASGAKQIGESAQLKARDVASRALAALESGSPEFAFKAQACRPVPNFMKSENWPTIIELLKKWLAT